MVVTQATTLVVSQAKSFAAVLFFPQAVLFDQVVDDSGLVAVGPASEVGEMELKWDEAGHRGAIVPVWHKRVSPAVAVQNEYWGRTGVIVQGDLRDKGSTSLHW